MTEAQRVAMLERPAGPVTMALDTDTFNEVDDQFAIAYAVRSAEEGLIDLAAICVAPFENRGYSFAEGMELSYEETLRTLDRLHCLDAWKNRVYRGATKPVRDGAPVHSEAVDCIIRLAKEPQRQGPLYVVAIGAATNVASALMIAPEIRERIVVVWLAGNDLHWSHTKEFNICQDVEAAQYLLDCGVPLVLMPTHNVVTAMTTSIPELAYYLEGKSDIGDYLVKIVREYAIPRSGPDIAWSKVVWDIVGPAWLLHPEWFETKLVPTPILTRDYHWAFDPHRPLMRIAEFVDRDRVFMDVFKKLQK